jgi:CrcB protein
MVMIGGSFGAISRYALSTLIKRRISAEFPVSTFTINLIGSFLIGILMAANTGNFNQLLLCTGFMGGFTTFSTFEMENINLFQDRNYKTLLLYTATSCICCIMIAILGLKLGSYFVR